ncbi:hypothetical protein BDW66DRAFT_152675 [Aspergillus desertorum]
MYHTTLFFQSVLLESLQQASLHLIIPSISFTIISAITASLIAKQNTPAYTLRASKILLTIGTLGLFVAAALTSARSRMQGAVYNLILVFPTLGVGMMAPSVVLTLLNSCTREDHAVSNGCFIMMRSLGVFTAAALGTTTLQNSFESSISRERGLQEQEREVTVQTTTTEITEKEPRKLWQNPHTYAIQALHSPWHRMMLRLQSSLFHASIDFFRREMAYEYLIVPLTTGSISSPMGLGSDSQPVSIEMSSGSEKTTSTYLADSQQFLLEYALRLQDVPRGVFYAGTSGRGEDPDATHLNQFFHIECELVGGLNVGMDVANKYIVTLTQALLASHGPEIARYAGTTAHMHQLLRLYQANNNSFPRIMLAEALALPEITRDMWELAVPGQPAYGRCLTRKGERMLIARFGGACWDMMMYEMCRFSRD